MSLPASLALLLFFMTLAGGAASSEVLVEANDYQIDEAAVLFELTALPLSQMVRIKSEPDRIRAVIRQIALREALSRSAPTVPVQEDAEVRYRLERAKKDELIKIKEQLVVKSAKAHLPELTARAKEVYMANRDAFNQPPELSMRHILLKAKSPEERLARLDQANAIADQIRSGDASFPELAEAISEDPGSSSQGGLLPVLSPTSLESEFGKSVRSLAEAGTRLAVVESPVGIHVVRIEQYAPGERKAFRDVESQITQKLSYDYLSGAVAEWKTKAVESQQLTYNTEAIDEFVERLNEMDVWATLMPEGAAVDD